MEHPNYEDLLAHLEGAGSAESAQDITRHLQQCSQCAAELAGWERTVQRLQSCEWPKPEVIRPALPGFLVKWAAAAVFVLGIGFGLGRLTYPSNAVIKTAVVTELKAQMASAVKAELLGALTDTGEAATDSFRQQFRRQFVVALAEQESTPDRKRLVNEILQAVQARQEENQRAIFARVDRVRQEHQADYLSLRHDLETAASVADHDLRENQQQLNHLTATLFAKDQN
jgi:hypothetical protein